jgi:hypothetical protein
LTRSIERAPASLALGARLATLRRVQTRPRSMVARPRAGQRGHESAPERRRILRPTLSPGRRGRPRRRPATGARPSVCATG